LPYAGIPAIVTAFLLIYAGRLDAFIILLYGLIIVFGYVAAVLDLKTKIIPNSFVLAMIAAWVLAMMPKLFLDIEETIPILINSSLGFVAGGGLFLLLYLISRKGLGGGDVKFMAATGLFLGLTGVLSAMLYGSVLAGLIGLVLLLLKKIGRKDAIPLAPFLYAGILISVFFR
jgi:prepilin signal peptidase PulO-like enzyme (type II secretory pathway)